MFQASAKGTVQAAEIASPYVKKGVDVATPYVKQGVNLAGEVAKPVISAAGPIVRVTISIPLLACSLRRSFIKLAPCYKSHTCPASSSS